MQPFEISDQMIPDISFALDVTENYVYVAAENTGLHIYENPAAVTAIDAQGVPKAYPVEFALSQNSPNPFNPQTSIRLFIPEAARLALEIYNIPGQKIRTLENRFLPAGRYGYQWDGTDDDGSTIGSGVYFCNPEAGEFSQVKKLVLTK